MKKSIIAKSVATFIIIGLIFLISSAGIHEYIHLKVLSLLGGDGYIVLLSEYTAADTVIITPPSNYTLYALSGGIFTALMFLALAYFAWSKKFTEMFAALIPVILMETFYGIFEGAFWSLPVEQYMAFAYPIVIGAGLTGLYISIYILYKDLKQKLLSFSVR